MTTSLDLRHINLGTVNFATFSKRSDAKRFAQAHGWLASDVISAANRFWKFWVIGQSYPEHEYRILCKDGTTADVPNLKHW